MTSIVGLGYAKTIIFREKYHDYNISLCKILFSILFYYIFLSSDAPFFLEKIENGGKHPLFRGKPPRNKNFTWEPGLSDSVYLTYAKKSGSQLKKNARRAL